MKKPQLFAGLILILIFHLASPAGAGGLAPGLAEHLAGRSDDEIVRVLVVLQDQADIAGLDRDLKAEKATRAARHRAVVGELQAAAKRSQGALVAELALQKTFGGVLGYRPHWIINSVVVTATVGTVREIADRDDVLVVEPDLVPVLLDEQPLKPADITAGKGATGYIAPGVQIVGAQRVWRELGITGAGTLVANMDSGVDVTHPALAGRWRGNTAPVAEAWRDFGGLGYATPGDPVGHGTHVMGTITGATAFDTVGVAPGAEWIATNAIASNTDFDNRIIAAFEWIADPDGNPATSDDVPDVCHNSWGVTPDHGYPHCDSTWWNVIDNCEAAGVVVTFSAGNEGPSPSTIRTPADRASSPTNGFSVGATSSVSPYLASTFSSRGPSLCGGPYAIKPEVVAPGENIVSCIPGGSYAYMDGTSMAGPHVAGVVALMRQAAPDLDVTTIKEILMDTAVDMGMTGDDNTYGRGMIDAYAAVLEVLGNVGGVAGVVTDAGGGGPLAGATVRDLRGDAQTVTGADGAYDFTILAGPTTLEIAKFGYLTAVENIIVPAGGGLALDAALAPMTPAVVTGTVRGPEGAAVAGAEVTVLHTPLAPVITGADGGYEIILPSGVDTSYEMLAVAPDLAYQLQSVGVQGDRTVDFDLPDLQRDGFESGGFETYPWVRTGTALWSVSGDEAWEGALSARSGAVGHSSSSTLELDYYVQGAGEVTFRCMVDSEPAYDVLRFYVDGVLEATWSGNVAWRAYTVYLPTGAHNLRWTYAKDASVSVGRDAAWIDLVELPGTGVQPLAAITFDQAELSAAVDAVTGTQQTLTVGNGGSARLDFDVVVEAPGMSPTSWLTVSPDTASVHPGSVRSLTVDFHGDRVGAGTHQALIRFLSNDPAHPDTAVTATLTVTPVSGADGAVPHRFALTGAVPNPFNPMTEIRFELPARSRTSLGVYDVSGRLVRVLVADVREAGAHSERWDGCDDAGRPAASGVYYARLQAAGRVTMKPMTLVR